MSPDTYPFKSIPLPSPPCHPAAYLASTPSLTCPRVRGPPDDGSIPFPFPSVPPPRPAVHSAAYLPSCSPPPEAGLPLALLGLVLLKSNPAATLLLALEETRTEADAARRRELRELLHAACVVEQSPLGRAPDGSPLSLWRCAASRCGELRDAAPQAEPRDERIAWGAVPEDGAPSASLGHP